MVIVFAQYHGMNFPSFTRCNDNNVVRTHNHLVRKRTLNQTRCNHKIFYLSPKILLNSRDFVIELTFVHIIAFMKSVVTPSKIRTVISFSAKALKCPTEKCFRRYCGFGFHRSNYILSNF